MRFAGVTFIILLFSCQQKSEKLFWINKTVNDKNDFLFMAESTNVEIIKPENLQKYLTPNELNEIQIVESKLNSIDTNPTTYPQFKEFGDIYKSSNFLLRVLFREGDNSLGRDYKFILRTYQHDWKIIDSYDIACWIKREEKYCFGSIDENLIIEKSCEADPILEKYLINIKGVFEKIR